MDVYFNSNVFLFLFLPYTLLWYIVAPRFFPSTMRTTAANLVIFLFSVFFYTWGERGFVLMLLASWMINYGLGRWAGKSVDAGRSTKPALIVAVLVNLGLLGWYKYAAFVVANLSLILKWFGYQELSPPTHHLPIGISFFTFQALSYVIDVCRGDVRFERSPLRFGVYVFLFPHLVAGPIVRYSDLAGQVEGEGREFRLDRFAEGVRRFVVGLAKKLLLADTFAEVADAGFALPPGQLGTAAAWLAVTCYGLQIYLDFSGYSDMAIGLASMFGFHFHENFRHPYLATSVTDFWRRWHISLSSWFRDYVYIPLGGNRGGPISTYRNLLVVFLLCGLWHGASWTFLLWGLWHGVFLIIERAANVKRSTTVSVSLAARGYTLLVVLGGWVLFRSTSLQQAGHVYLSLLGVVEGGAPLIEIWTPKLWAALPFGVLACGPVLTALSSWQETLQSRWDTSRSVVLEAISGICRTAWLAALILGVTVQLSASRFSPFIYFRF